MSESWTEEQVKDVRNQAQYYYLEKGTFLWHLGALEDNNEVCPDGVVFYNTPAHVAAVVAKQSKPVDVRTYSLPDRMIVCNSFRDALCMTPEMSYATYEDAVQDKNPLQKGSLPYSFDADTGIDLYSGTVSAIAMSPKEARTMTREFPEAGDEKPDIYPGVMDPSEAREAVARIQNTYKLIYYDADALQRNPADTKLAERIVPQLLSLGDDKLVAPNQELDWIATMSEVMRTDVTEEQYQKALAILAPAADDPLLRSEDGWFYARFTNRQQLLGYYQHQKRQFELTGNELASVTLAEVLQAERLVDTQIKVCQLVDQLKPGPEKQAEMVKCEEEIALVRKNPIVRAFLPPHPVRSVNPFVCGDASGEASARVVLVPQFVKEVLLFSFPKRNQKILFLGEVHSVYDIAPFVQPPVCRSRARGECLDVFAEHTDAKASYNPHSLEGGAAWTGAINMVRASADKWLSTTSPEDRKHLRYHKWDLRDNVDGDPIIFNYLLSTSPRGDQSHSAEAFSSLLDWTATPNLLEDGRVPRLETLADVDRLLGRVPQASPQKRALVECLLDEDVGLLQRADKPERQHAVALPLFCRTLRSFLRLRLRLRKAFGKVRNVGDKARLTPLKLVRVMRYKDLIETDFYLFYRLLQTYNDASKTAPQGAKNTFCPNYNRRALVYGGAYHILNIVQMLHILPLEKEVRKCIGAGRAIDYADVVDDFVGPAVKSSSKTSAVPKYTPAAKPKPTPKPAAPPVVLPPTHPARYSVASMFPGLFAAVQTNRRRRSRTGRKKRKSSRKRKSGKKKRRSRT